MISSATVCILRSARKVAFAVQVPCKEDLPMGPLQTTWTHPRFDIQETSETVQHMMRQSTVLVQIKIFAGAHIFL